MFGTFVSATRAVAPFAGQAAVAGAKAAAGLTIATKATNYAHSQARNLLDNLSAARQAARDANEAVKSEKAQEQAS